MAGGIGIVRRFASSLAGRAGLAKLAGLTFGGDRDLFSALGYQRKLAYGDFLARYLRNGIAGRCVDIIVQETWRSGIEIVEDEDPNVVTAFEKAWADLEDVHGVAKSLESLDTLAGIGRYGVLLIGAPGDPAGELGRPGKLLFLAPYGEGEMTVDRFVEDSQDPRFGLPLSYKLNVTGRPQAAIHWSRVIHAAEGTLGDPVYGIPRLERVWNLLDDFEKVSGAGAEAYWLRVHGGWQFDIKPDLELDEKDMLDLKEEVEEFVHGISRVMRTRGVEVNQLGGDVSPFASQIDTIVTQIAGAMGIPKRILTGSERGELSSTQDRANWQDRIEGRRKGFAEAAIVRPLVDRFTAAGILPTHGDYEVAWSEEEELDEGGKATVALSIAQANAAFGGELMSAAEVRDRIWGLEPLEIEPESESEPEPEPDEASLVARAMARIRRVRVDATLDGKALLVARAMARIRRARDSRRRS